MQTFALSSSSSRQYRVTTSPDLRLLNDFIAELADESNDCKVRRVVGHQLSSLVLAPSIPALLLVLLAHVNYIANYIIRQPPLYKTACVLRIA